MHISEEKIAGFQKYIFDWYATNKRDFPWRKTRDPYAILISEVMSQQTQIERIVEKYVQWLLRFPTVADLAGARVADILPFWLGLGYNRRALHLHETAQILMQSNSGIFPRQKDKLLALPGIGTYTADALLCFAFDQQTAVIDTNVRKVILLYFYPPEGRQQIRMDAGRQKEIRNIATVLLPKHKAYVWNQALMDYAAKELKKEKISGTKQSPFAGSDRYYRGKIIKHVLRVGQIPFCGLGPLIKKDYTRKDEEWLKKLVKTLEREGFITVMKNNVKIRS
jgi:A/G-specific adenine glycosylase